MLSFPDSLFRLQCLFLLIWLASIVICLHFLLLSGAPNPQSALCMVMVHSIPHRFLFLFWGHTLWCSGFTLGFELKHHTQCVQWIIWNARDWIEVDYMECQVRYVQGKFLSGIIIIFIYLALVNSLIYLRLFKMNYDIVETRSKEI